MCLWTVGGNPHKHSMQTPHRPGKELLMIHLLIYSHCHNDDRHYHYLFMGYSYTRYIECRPIEAFFSYYCVELP